MGTLRSPSIFPQEADAQMCAEAAEPQPGRPPEQLWVLPKHRGTIYPAAQVAAWLFLFTWGGFAAVAVVGAV